MDSNKKCRHCDGPIDFGRCLKCGLKVPAAPVSAPTNEVSAAELCPANIEDVGSDHSNCPDCSGTGFVAKESGEQVKRYDITPAEFLDEYRGDKDFNKRDACQFAAAYADRLQERVAKLEGPPISECPKGHRVPYQGCKHCGIISDFLECSRSELIGIVLKWHDAFYREENRANKISSELATYKASLPERAKELNAALVALSNVLMIINLCDCDEEASCPICEGIRVLKESHSTVAIPKRVCDMVKKGTPTSPGNDNPCELSMCIFVKAPGSRYCRHHRNTMEAYENRHGKENNG